jgi:hypothetical protein
MIMLRGYKHANDQLMIMLRGYKRDISLLLIVSALWG